MKQVVLDTATARTPQEIYAAVEQEGLQPGDGLKVLQQSSTEQEGPLSAMIVVLIVVLWYMSSKEKKEKERIAAEILDDVFGKYNSAEELEKELKEEFNISVTTETVPAAASDWSKLSMGTFERAAYGDDEPDISHRLASGQPGGEQPLLWRLPRRTGTPEGPWPLQPPPYRA